MKIGYARTSTLDQVAGFEQQTQELRAAGCEEVYSEQVSALKDRPQLDKLLAYIRRGDVVTVTKLDRLARSMQHLLEILAAIDAKGASLRILNMGLDTASPTGKLMLGVLGSVAQFEREMMLERQRIGIDKAKRDGKYHGRVPTAMRRADEVRALLAEKVGPTEVAERLGLSRSSVYRVMALEETVAH